MATPHKNSPKPAAHLALQEAKGCTHLYSPSATTSLLQEALHEFFFFFLNILP